MATCFTKIWTVTSGRASWERAAGMHMLAAPMRTVVIDPRGPIEAGKAAEEAKGSMHVLNQSTDETRHIYVVTVLTVRQ